VNVTVSTVVLPAQSVASMTRTCAPACVTVEPGTKGSPSSVMSELTSWSSARVTSTVTGGAKVPPSATPLTVTTGAVRSMPNARASTVALPARSVAVTSKVWSPSEVTGVPAA
jgi:hypothetical protein